MTHTPTPTYLDKTYLILLTKYGPDKFCLTMVEDHAHHLVGNPSTDDFFPTLDDLRTWVDSGCPGWSSGAGDIDIEWADKPFKVIDAITFLPDDLL